MRSLRNEESADDGSCPLLFQLVVEGVEHCSIVDFDELLDEGCSLGLQLLIV